MLQLRELEDKYAECMEMLHEAQEELKNLRNKTMPNAISRRYHSLGLFPMVSRCKKKKKQLHTPGNNQPEETCLFASDFQLQGWNARPQMRVGEMGIYIVLKGYPSDQFCIPGSETLVLCGYLVLLRYSIQTAAGCAYAGNLG